MDTAIEKLIIELYKIKWNKEELTMRDILYELYINQEKSIRTIADELKLGKNTVHNLLRKYYIPTRPSFKV